MSKMLRRSTRREIFSTFGRFISIFAIVAIGVAFFSGVRISNDFMLENGDIYLSDLNFYDIRVITPLGSNEQEIIKITSLDGVNAAEGAHSVDAIASVGYSDEVVYRFHSITEKINKTSLTHGRMPQSENECLLDAKYFGKDALGARVVISDNNEEDEAKKFSGREYTVVGTVTSPLYLNFERGGTNVGNGRISAFVYLPASAFSSEDFDEIYLDLALPGAIYSEEYDTALDECEERIKGSVASILNERVDAEILSARNELSEKEKELNDEKSKFEDEKKKALDEFEQAKATLDDQKKQLDEAYDDIDGKISKLVVAQGELRASVDAISEQMKTVEDPALLTELDYMKTRLLYELNEVNTTLSTLKALKLSEEETFGKYESALKEYIDAYSKAMEEFASAEEKIAEAETEIKKAYEELDVKIDWDSLIYTRNFNTGYACFENDVDIVDAIGRVFPIFFFAVAALVCMTTMARMVDEQRTVIGTLMALGHKKGEIRAKYMWYSGIAAVGGCLAGFALGTYFIPKIIRIIYTMMYDFKDSKEYVFFPMTLVISLAATLVCSLGVTWLSLRKTFKSVPAELMRPTAPSNGGRILLESTGALWESMPFLNKVTARNIFRYKKRMLMMIIGICGCTALLLTGFGLKDSIYNIVDDQFENITVYDSAALLSDEYTDDDKFKKDFADALGSIESYLPVMQLSGDIQNGDVSKDVTVMVTRGEDIEGFVELSDGDESLLFPSKGFVAIDKSLAEMLDVNVGGVVKISDPDYNAYDLIVSAIFDNYIGHYAIMSSETLSEKGGEVKFNTVLFNHKAETDVYEVASLLTGSGKTLTVTLNKDTADNISSMLSNMNYVILIVLVFASSLAFVVLFNLTNINVTERRREIATLKVLGFTEKESRKYIFRENNILTLVGAAFGIPFGILLHLYCMDQIKIDLVTFIPKINLESYLIAYGLTVVFVIIVNLFMRGKITSVDMAGSLKSAE